jgi:hypothetical protein
MLANYDIKTIQKLPGHGDVRTTIIYLQTVPSVTLKEARSPMDRTWRILASLAATCAQRASSFIAQLARAAPLQPR